MLILVPILLALSLLSLFLVGCPLVGLLGAGGGTTAVVSNAGYGGGETLALADLSVYNGGGVIRPTGVILESPAYNQPHRGAAGAAAGYRANTSNDAASIDSSVDEEIVVFKPSPEAERRRAGDNRLERRFSDMSEFSEYEGRWEDGAGEGYGQEESFALRGEPRLVTRQRSYERRDPRDRPLPAPPLQGQGTRQGRMVRTRSGGAAPETGGRGEHRDRSRSRTRKPVFTEEIVWSESDA